MTRRPWFIVLLANIPRVIGDVAAELWAMLTPGDWM